MLRIFIQTKKNTFLIFPSCSSIYIQNWVKILYIYIHIAYMTNEIYP